DVELDVRGDRARRHPRLRRALRVEPRSRHRVDEPHAVDGRHLVEPGALEHPAERPRAEEAPVAPFLVATRRDDQRPAVARAWLADRLPALETRHDDEGS